MKNERDQMIAKLQSKIEQKKKDLKSINESNLTNCMFGYEEGNISSRTNISSVQEVELVKMLAFLLSRVEFHKQACEKIGVQYPFKWCGYSYDEWESDIIRRVRKINVTKERAQLEQDEKVLADLLSPDAKAKNTLDEIASRLGI